MVVREEAVEAQAQLLRLRTHGPGDGQILRKIEGDPQIVFPKTTVSTASAVAALAKMAASPALREHNPQLYRMVVGVLRTIAKKPSPLNVPAFYWKLLANEGMRPQLDVCVRCGDAEPSAQLVSFDLNEGGVLCRSCRSGQSISPDALAMLRDILGGRLAHALSQDESPVTHEVAGLATKALEFHIERRLRAVAMFEAH